MTAPTAKNRVRPQRAPIGTGNRLTAKQRPGYHRRYVNDQDDRIARFEEAGYTVVLDTSEDTSSVRAGSAAPVGSVVRKPVGGGTFAVLMEIPDEWYQEDQEAKARRVDAIEDAMEPQLKEGQYGEIAIKRN